MFDLTKVLETNLERQIGFVRASENKISFLFPVLSVSIAVWFSIFSVSDFTNIFAVSFAFLSACGLTLSTLFSFKAMFPNTGGPNNSLIFFGSISQKNISTLETEYSALTDEQYKTDLINQIYINSKIAALKYKNFQVALCIWYGTVILIFIFALPYLEKFTNAPEL